MPPTRRNLREGAHSKRSLPVVDQNAYAIGMGVEDQIRLTIPGQVGGGHAGHITTQGFHSLREGLLGDVLEAPVAPVAPQRGPPPGGPEEHIQSSVSVHIGQSDPRPVEQQLIGEVPRSGNGVGEIDAGLSDFEAQETNSTQGSLCGEH